MVQTLFTAFAVIFIVWVLFEEIGEGKDSKKKEGEGGGFGGLLKILAIPFLLLGGVLFLLGRLVWSLLKHAPEILQKIVNLLQSMTEKLSALFNHALSFIWQAMKGAYGLLRAAMKDLRTVWKIGKSIAGFLQRVMKRLMKFLGWLGRTFDSIIEWFNAFAWKTARFLLRMMLIPWRLVRRMMRSSKRSSTEKKSQHERSTVRIVLKNEKIVSEKQKPLALWLWLMRFFDDVDDEKNQEYQEPVTRQKLGTYEARELSDLQAIGWHTRRRLAKM